MPSGEPFLSIVLPAYNEEARLGPALDELFAYLCDPSADAARLPATVRVLVVDDGSSDGTAALVRARPEFEADCARASLRLMTVPHAGKGSAVRAGMLAADGDYVVFADADMATPPTQLPLLVDALATADVVLGSRVQPNGFDMRASQPRLRRFLGRAFHFAAGLWVSGADGDTQCGFKGFRAGAARDLFSRQLITSIVFDVEIIHLARRRGYRIATVPVVWTDRRGSRLRARPRLALRVAWDLFRIPLLHRGVRRAAAEPPAAPPPPRAGTAPVPSPVDSGPALGAETQPDRPPAPPLP